MTNRFGRLVWLVPVAVAVGLVLVVAGVGHLIMDGPSTVRDWDASVARWLADSREKWLVDVTDAGTNLADTWTIVGATALLAAVAAWRSRSWWLPAGVLLLTAGETAIYQLSNTLVDRPRPDVLRLDPGDPRAGFPPGHVAASVCFYGGLAAVLLGVVWRDTDRPAWLRAWSSSPSRSRWSWRSAGPTGGCTTRPTSSWADYSASAGS